MKDFFEVFLSILLTCMCFAVFAGFVLGTVALIKLIPGITAVYMGLIMVGAGFIAILIVLIVFIIALVLTVEIHRRLFG